jgi:hypothetical protein
LMRPPESRAATNDSEIEVEVELDPSSKRDTRSMPVSRPHPHLKPRLAFTQGSSTPMRVKEQESFREARAARISTGLYKLLPSDRLSKFDSAINIPSPSGRSNGTVEAVGRLVGILIRVSSH